MAILVLWAAWSIHQVSPGVREWSRQVWKRLPRVVFPVIPEAPSTLPLSFPPAPPLSTVILTETETKVHVETRTVITEATAGTVLPVPDPEPLTQTLPKTVTVEKFCTSTKTVHGPASTVTDCQLVPSPVPQQSPLSASPETKVNPWVDPLIGLAQFVIVVALLMKLYERLVLELAFFFLRWVESASDVDIINDNNDFKVGRPTPGPMLETGKIGVGARVRRASVP
jgi:hypothetical protein